jgi:RimJ/RimL family protein N-acetyltransferase
MGPPALAPLALEGADVRLEPLAERHLDALWNVAKDREIWRWYAVPVLSREELAAWVGEALKEAAGGRTLPFATCLRASGEVVGSTRFAAYSPENERVEIGWTFVGRAWQRTAINSEAKLLMLRHAFETLHLERVELKTDSLNEASRRAILRLGATEEGTLRSHMLCSSGRRRDSVYYSILRGEWPDVRERLEQRLRT